MLLLQKHLSVYFQDHFAGATAGADLALSRTLHLLVRQGLSTPELERLLSRADEQLEKIEACRRKRGRRPLARVGSRELVDRRHAPAKVR
jgi:hypothetical protein